MARPMGHYIGACGGNCVKHKGRLAKRRVLANRKKPTAPGAECSRDAVSLFELGNFRSECVGFGAISFQP